MFNVRPKRLRSQIVDTVSKLKNLCNHMMKLEEFAFDTETNTLRVLGDNPNFRIVGISISWGAYHNYYIPLGHIRDEDLNRQLDLDVVVDYMKPVFEREDVRIIGQNMKFDFHVLSRIGIVVKTPDVFDTMIASWLCDENTPNGLKENSQVKLGIDQTHFTEVTESVPVEFKKKCGLKANSKATFDMVLINEAAPYALDDAFYTFELYKGFLDELEEQKMDKIYFKVYVPFIRTIFDMERRGVTVDVSRLDEMSREIDKDMEDLQYKIIELAGVEFSLSSGQQLAELLFGYRKKAKDGSEGKVNENILAHSFNFRVLSTTAGGTPQTNADVFWKLSQMSFKDKRKKEGVELCNLMLDYKKLDKLRSAFIDGLKEQLYDDGKAHPSFNIIGTDSGRLSCIAKDTPIKCVGEDKPIQDVKVGDLVYCYDKQGIPHIRKVLNVIDNGVRPCVEVKYRSQGTHEYDSLICTPDHKILKGNLEWVRADSLSSNDQLVHLRRSLTQDRPRLYGYNSFCEQEQITIKREIFNCNDPKTIIHHKDFNKLNNSLSNLVLMPIEEHTRLHTDILLKEGKLDTYTFCHSNPPPVRKGKECYNFIQKTAVELENLVRQYKGRIRDIPMDFDTFKKKCHEVDFDYKKVAGEYQTQYREVSDDEFIKCFYEHKGVPYAISRSLNIGRVKVAKTIRRLDLCYNHRVVSVTELGDRQVYDLEVEDFHNFIASEICVHNCSSPNLQQLPKADEEDKYQIRSLFIGSQYLWDDIANKAYDYEGGCVPSDHMTLKRKKIVALDFANLEMRVLAHFSEDKNLLEMFAKDSDTHGSTAVNMFNLDCTPEEVKKKYPHLRQAAKVLNFLLMYGGGAARLYDQLKSDHGHSVDLGDKTYLDTYKVKNGLDVAQIYIDKYFDTYSGVSKFIRDQKRYAHKYGYVYTLLKRKRRLPDINGGDFKVQAYCERLAVNSAVQGSAADLTMSAQNRVSADPWFYEHEVYMMLQVHDELVFECPEEYVDECITRVQKYMSHPFGDNVELNLPMRADADSGNSYQEAK